MKYTDNNDLILQYKHLLLDIGVKQTYIAGKMGITKQALTHKMSKKNFSFDDMQQLLDTIGYELHYDFIKK